jgi:hypothetical protein
VARDSKRRIPTAPPSEIQQALDYIRQQIAAGQIRPTIGDLIRLLEIRQAQEPADVVACWYSPNAPEGTCPVCLRPSDPQATARFREILQRQHARPPAPAPQEQP